MSYADQQAAERKTIAAVVSVFVLISFVVAGWLASTDHVAAGVIVVLQALFIAGVAYVAAARWV